MEKLFSLTRALVARKRKIFALFFALAASIGLSWAGVAVDGRLPGEFSIAKNKKVYFSQGNLQYNKSTKKWSFMTNQYDKVETDKQEVGTNYANQNIVSFFCWGNGNNPTGTSESNKQNFTDYGVNPISNGGNVANMWRTLSEAEWVYMLNQYERSDFRQGTRFAKAKLFGTTYGLIIFPDNYAHPSGVAAVTGVNKKDGTSWDANQYSATDWAKMEAAGCVFLPAAGIRWGTMIRYVNTEANYWTSTPVDNTLSKYEVFTKDAFASVSKEDRNGYGMCVRLVLDKAYYKVTYKCTDKTSGTVPSDATSYLKGSSVTVKGAGDLAKTGYNFAGWTNGTTTYTEGKTFNITANITLTAQWTLDMGPVNNVIALINAIGTVTYPGSGDKITAAREAYDALAVQAQKDAVTNYATLTDAEAAYLALQPDVVAGKIDAIGEVTYTAECKAKIDEARAAYDALPPATQAQVGNYAKLQAAEATYAELLAQAVKAVKDQIDALPATPLTDATKKLSEYNKVTDARAAYDALSDAEKAAVDNYDKLTAAEAAFAAIPSVGSETVITWDKNTGIEKMSGTATSPAYEGITISIKGGGFGPQDEMLRFNIAGLGLSFEFANTLGENFQKIVISSTNVMPSTPLAGMGEGWAASNENKTATWTGDAATVKIWDGLTATSFWDVNTIQFTFGATVSATEAAQAALDKINAIPSPVVYTPECSAAIKAAREAVDALGANASLIDDADLQKLTDAETAYATAKTEAVNAVKTAINALPATPLTDADKKLSEYNKVLAARAAYDALLNADDKDLVTNLTKLEAAEEAFAAISGGGGSAPAGALNGKFTINADGDQILFSKGNLQATTEDNGANWTWSFAAHQWDNIGIEVANSKINGNGTVSENGTVDLFGWSTNATYYGINNSVDVNDYLGEFKEWGTLMGTGWRTLTKDEWSYLRQHSSNGKATVNDKNGYIFLPDNWSGPDFTANPSNWTTNVYSGDDWTAMENAGAVFLPHGYPRVGIEKKNTIASHYWSATCMDTDKKYAYAFFFSQYQAEAYMDGPLNEGCLVRLVAVSAPSPLADAQAAKDLIDAIPSPVVYTPECKEAIKAAREALDALSDEAKALFNEADTAALPAAETAYAGLLAEKVAPVIAAIDAVPATPLTPENTKLSEYNKVTDARALYDALATDEEKAAVTNYDKLTAAEAAFAAISGGGGSAPAGALNGKFTINAGGDQISFAKGNLQATTTDLGDHWTWGFAANQWDYLGIAVANSKINGNGTVSENGTVDLFGWSTAATYYGINNSDKFVDYPGDFVDWGPNMGAGWRTLTKDEWNYLIENNTKGRATVNDKNGYIFLPNDWSGPAFTPDPNNFTTNVYSGDDWTAMENAGAVFLPCGPARNRNSALVAMDVKYYSSTSLNNDTSYVFTIYYNQSQSACTGTNRAYGCMVRLVTEGAPSPLNEAQAALDKINAIPQPVVYTPECKEAIKAAREALDALGDDAKALFAEADTAALPQAEATYAGLLAEKVAPVIAAIDAVPATPLTPENTKLSEYNKVTDARALYDALTDEEKNAVTNYAKLTAAEAAFAAIGGGTGLNVSTEDIGKVLCADGSLYATKDEATAASKTPVAMIAYVEDSKGLAIALEDESDRMIWSTAITAAAAHTPAVTGGTWKLPSLLEWQQMFVGCGADLTPSETSGNVTDYLGLRDKLSAAGGNGFVEWSYWTTTEWADNPAGYAWDPYFSPSLVKWYKDKKDRDDFYIRAILAFNVVASNALADAQAAKDLIDAIGEVSYPDSKDAIKAAREALDALSDEAKALFNEADTAALPAAEATYAGLLAQKVAPVIAAIDAVPATPLTDATKKLSEYNKVTDARALYDALATDEEKAAVGNYSKLTDAEAAFAVIDKGGRTVYDSGSVALTDLKVGDVLKGGVTLIGEATDKVGLQSLALNGEKKDGQFTLSFQYMTPLLGENAAITSGSMVFTPIAEDGNAGDAWIVFDGSNIAEATVWLKGINSAALPSVLADAQAALDKINAIPQPVVLSDECKAKIDAAREAVTALGENASLIDDADIDKLEKAEEKFAELIEDATAVVAKIEAIGDVTFSAECKEKIVDARNAYEALSDELKPYVTNLDKLTAAEAAYEAARPFAPVTTVPAAVEALQYTGAAQALITAGAVEHGTILYSLDGVDYSAELPTALLPGAYTVYYKVQATDDYKDVAPATVIATIAYNYPATYGLFGIPEGWSVKVNDEEVAVVNGAVKNIAANDRFDIMPVKPEDVKLVEIVPYLLDLATATDSVIYLMNGDSITGTAKGNITIVIVPDAKVYFKDVNLTNTGSHPAVLCGGNAEMVVVGENSITCTTEGEYGIRAAGAGTTLTISGDKAHLSATIDHNGGTVNQ